MFVYEYVFFCGGWSGKMDGKEKWMLEQRQNEMANFYHKKWLSILLS